MIQERDFRGLTFDTKSSVDQQIQRALQMHKPRIVYPGQYDITPADTRYTSYEYQLGVFQDGHGEIRGRRRVIPTPSLGDAPRCTPSEEERAQQVKAKDVAVPELTYELLAKLDENCEKTFFLFTLDVDHFLKTHGLRRRLWKIYSYYPGAYPQVH